MNAVKSLGDGLDALRGQFQTQMGTCTQQMSAAVAAFTEQAAEVKLAVTNHEKKLDAVVGIVRDVQQAQQRQTAAVKRVQAAITSRAALEMRSNTMVMFNVPIAGAFSMQTAGAAVKRALADAGVPFSSTVEDGKVWSLGLVSAGENYKKPGAITATIQVLTVQERYLLLNPRTTSNLKAKGMGINIDLTPVEQENRAKLFADPRFKAAFDKASDIRKQQGNRACVKRWALDRCILGTGVGRQTVEWSVEYLEELDAQQRTAAANMQVDLSA